METDRPNLDNMEDVVRYVDKNNRWQYLTMARCCVLVIGMSVVVYGQAIFFTGKLQHECVLYEDGTDAARANLTLIKTFNNTRANHTRESIACALPSEAGGAKCTKWQYNSPYYDLTMMNEYDLVCSRSVWVPTFQSAVVWGQLIGLPMWGVLSDRFGRLSILRLTYALFLATTLAMSLVKSLVWLITLRAIMGFILCAVWNACFVLCMELSTPEVRNSVGVLVGTGWPIGATLSALLAYYIRNYRHLGWAILGVAVLCAPVAFFMEESPRWLVMQKRFNKAKKMLKRRAKTQRNSGKDGNKLLLPEGTEFLQRIYRRRIEQDSASEKASQLSQIMRLLTERRLRIRTLALSITWIGVAFVFNGLLYYGTGELPFSPMLTFGIISAIRIFTQPVYVWISNYFGVRNGMIYALAVTAVTTIVMVFIPIHGKLVWSIFYGLFSLTALLAIDHCLAVIYIVTGELYPTVLRQSSLGFFSMTARFGSIAAPYVATLFAQYWLPLPAFVFAMACVVSTLCALALPRADDAMLPDTVTEAELIDDDLVSSTELCMKSSITTEDEKVDSPVTRNGNVSR